MPDNQTTGRCQYREKSGFADARTQIMEEFHKTKKNAL